MASTIHSLVNSLLASNFSEVAGRLPLAPVQQQFKSQQPLVTTVKADESALNEQRLDDKSSQQQLTQQQTQERRQTLKDLANPKLSLLPSDEVELFAVASLDDAATQGTQASLTLIQSGDVSDAANRARRQVLAQDDRKNASDALLKRAQQSVATLYARNGNAVYNVTPILYEAA